MTGVRGRRAAVSGQRWPLEEPPYARGEREGSTAEADARFLEMCAPPGEPVIIATHSDTSSDKVRHAFGRNHLSDRKQQIRQLIKAALETSGLPRFQRGKTFRVENVNFSLAAQNL
jgi:hypothetical protein